MQLSVMSRSESLAAFCAAPLEHEATVFGGHARAKTVGLRPSSVVRLKSALRHSDESPIKTKTLRLIFVRSYVKKRQVVWDHGEHAFLLILPSCSSDDSAQEATESHS